MVDRRKVAFEEKTLPRKQVQELFVRNSQRRIELENVYKQLNKGREDCKEKFVKSRFELLYQLQHRRSSLPGFGAVSARSPSVNEPSATREVEDREPWLVQLPLRRKHRGKTICFSSHEYAARRGVVKPKEPAVLKPRSLSEILPPVTLPPIHMQLESMQHGRGTLKTGKGHRAVNKDEGSHRKTRNEGERQVVRRQDTLDNLSDCRYLRGNIHG